MLNRLLWAALLLCAPGASLAEPTRDEPSSMRFEWVREGPADVCGTACREWISATGPIAPETAQDFEFFRQARNVRGATLVLDSGGGSVLASLEFGRKVREFGMITSVGRTLKLPAAAGEDQRAKLSPRGECASMCVFVLLGGVKRQVPAEARILVHQIWPGGKRYDASAESYTAEEMVRIQRDVGRIAKYTVEMGGDIELFELAMRIPPWERLRALSAGEMRRMGLQTIELAETPTSGAVTTGRPPKVPTAPLAERGWTLLSTAPQPAVQRRHTLTIEGDEVGEFALTLACAGSGGGYKVAYAESRALGEQSPARLRDVTLYLDGERTTLKVEASELRTDGSELTSRATGVVPQSFVNKLRKDPTSVIIVGTKTTDEVRTSIRVGSTGFAKVFPRVGVGCAS